MPSRADASTTSRTESMPARWPSARGRCRRAAHRPLPSMMTATCIGSRSKSTSRAREASREPAGAQVRRSSRLIRALFGGRRAIRPDRGPQPPTLDDTEPPAPRSSRRASRRGGRGPAGPVAGRVRRRARPGLRCTGRPGREPGAGAVPGMVSAGTRPRGERDPGGARSVPPRRDPRSAAPARPPPGPAGPGPRRRGSPRWSGPCAGGSRCPAPR